MRRKGDIESTPVPKKTLSMIRPTLLQDPIIPTYDRRHRHKIREGKQSAEVFSKARLATIPVDPFVLENKQLTNKKSLKKLRERGEDAS